MVGTCPTTDNPIPAQPHPSKLGSKSIPKAHASKVKLSLDSWSCGFLLNSCLPLHDVANRCQKASSLSDLLRLRRGGANCSLAGTQCSSLRNQGAEKNSVQLGSRTLGALTVDIGND